MPIVSQPPWTPGEGFPEWGAASSDYRDRSFPIRNVFAAFPGNFPAGLDRRYRSHHDDGFFAMVTDWLPWIVVK